MEAQSQNHDRNHSTKRARCPASANFGRGIDSWPTVHILQPKLKMNFSIYREPSLINGENVPKMELTTVDTEGEAVELVDRLNSRLQFRYDYESTNRTPENILAGELAAELVCEPYVWPGAYAKYAITDDGGALCACCCSSESELIEQSCSGDGWHVVAIDHVENCEENLTCDHCGESVDSRGISN